jgi:5-methylcytosine-specific restriction endonuclease McrA
MNLLREKVLVLNRNWQAVRVIDVELALTDMVRGAMTGLDTSDPDNLRPLTWSEWAELPVAEGELCIHTVKRKIKIPTVVALCSYAKMHRRRPKLCAKTIRQRDGNRCQYTGKVIKPDEGNLDHVVPRSRGGRDSWENLVWSSKEVNAKKSNRLNAEAGLKLIRPPRAPAVSPAALIEVPENRPEWRMFLVA